MKLAAHSLFFVATLAVSGAAEMDDAARLKLIQETYPLVYSLASDDHDDREFIHGTVNATLSRDNAPVIICEVKEWADLRKYIDLKIVFYRNADLVCYGKTVGCNEIGLLAQPDDPNGNQPKVGDRFSLMSTK